jgi:hypothetical protein
LKGDLIVGLGGDLVEGDLVGGFGIGNADVPIWGGGEWSRDSVPPRGARGPAGSLPSISLSSRCQ